MEKTKIGIVFGMLILMTFLVTSVFILAKPDTNLVTASNNKANVVIPVHAVQLSEGVFSLGFAQDVDGKVVEGFMFVDDRREDSHKPNHPDNPSGDKKPKPSDGESSCYSFLAKGAKWKTVEDYIIGQGINSVATQASLAEWNTNSPVQIFGNEVTGVVDGVDSVSPDGKNEVMFGSAGSNTIAVTTVWGVFGGPPQGRKLVEWDALFNSAVFNFGDADVEANPVMDYMNIAVHEFGHSAGMGHAPATIDCVDETMYPTASYDETSKRDLNAGDITGVNKLYS